MTDAGPKDAEEINVAKILSTLLVAWRGYVRFIMSKSERSRLKPERKRWRMRSDCTSVLALGCLMRFG